MVDISHLTTNGRMIFLACTEGMDTGVEDFNEKTINPAHIFDLAVQVGFNAIVFSRGIAEKYYQDYRSRIPLVVMLNGHSRFNQPDGWGTVLCSVEEAVSLGASAVGHTLYLGSIHEAEMARELSQVVREAHERGIPVLARIIPRGPEIVDHKYPDLIAYTARFGLELGVDLVEVYHPGNLGALRWVEKAAGRCKVLISDEGTSGEEYCRQARELMQANLGGVVARKSIWQAENPEAVSHELKNIIYNGNI